MANEEDKKKQIEEEQLALARKEEKIRRMMFEASQKAQNSVMEPQEFEVNLVTDDHWKQITDLHQKRPDALPIKNGILAFITHQDAKLFFTDMAARGLEFLATHLENNKPVDHHFFSCGQGKTYEGSFAEILEQLKSALKTETAPDLTAKLNKGIEYIKNSMPKDSNPASEMRSKLQQVTESEMQAHSDKSPGNPFK